MTDEKKVMIFAEQRGGKIHPISLELLGKGREIADKLKAELSAVILGHNIEREELMELIYYGADKVYSYDHPVFEYPDVMQYKHNIVKLIQQEHPEVFLV
ncbi:MAG: electron transfer flavoprotein subunit alpha, partial [Thermoproteota archaeon]